MNPTVDDVDLHGWTAVPRAFGVLLEKHPAQAQHLSIDGSLEFPSESPLVIRVLQTAKSELSSETFDHSMRVYHYGEHAHTLSLYCNSMVPYPDVNAEQLRALKSRKLIHPRRSGGHLPNSLPGPLPEIIPANAGDCLPAA